MKKNTNTIGIEYDSHEIRAVNVAMASGKFHVDSFNSEILPDNVINEGIISDPILFESVLTELIKNINYKYNTPCAIGISNKNTIMRLATFPKVPEDKLTDVVKMQAQDFIPIPINELAMDYVVVEENVNDDDEKALSILLVGAKNVLLDNIVSNFDKAKIEITDIDSSFLAWCRVLIKEREKDGDNKPYGFLKITDDILNFAIIKSDKIKMVRSINLPDSIAIEVKRLFNYPEDLSEMEEESIIKFLLSEINSSISYYHMQFDENISSVFFSATIQHENSIIKKINEALPISINKTSLYKEYSTESFKAEDYAGCISLALSLMEVDN